MLEFGIQSQRRIFYAGERVRFFLKSDTAFPAGKAFLRTNLGMAAVRRREIINEIKHNQRRAGRDWHDIALEQVSCNEFASELFLTENGIFELKGFFAPDECSGICLWPEGENLKLKVEAAENIGANLVYTAFVRQFGRNCSRSFSDNEDADLQKLDNAGYSVIPRSGTFRKLKDKLDFIFGRLGCRILQLLPIHPVPTVYGRMGRFGSPFAVLDYFAVDPALAEFDECATPLEQFCELVDAVHARQGRIFLDIPVNHTGWASVLQSEHPEWFVRDARSRRIESPGAWGIVWEDLCKLDYSEKEVTEYMADVFLYWCRRGVDGFRCDAGYMLPESAWRYIESKVRSEYPDTVFMLEGLGGPPEKQEVLLRDCNLDWAYSELFQNYSRSEVENYINYAKYVSNFCGTLINFAETHDNNRLASVSHTFAAMRCALMCFLSESGAFGFANGVEWFAQEKIDVHRDSALNWGAGENMVTFLQRLHAVMRLHPAFYGGAEFTLQNLSGDEALAIRRCGNGEEVLALINLNCREKSQVRFSFSRMNDAGAAFCDLLTGRPYALEICGECFCAVLEPGESRLLSRDQSYLEKIDDVLAHPFRMPEKIRNQKLELALGRILLAAGIEPQKNIRKFMNKFQQDWRQLFRCCPVVVFRDGIDNDRLLMVPPGWCLAVQSSGAFRAELKDGDKTLRFECSVQLNVDTHIALFPPLDDDKIPDADPVLNLTCFENDAAIHRRSFVRYLPLPEEDTVIKLCFDNDGLKSAPPRYALGTNDLGGYCQIPGCWGGLVSKYDCLLAGNLNEEYPVDRRIMLIRCKVWVVLNGFSQEVDFALQEHFRIGNRNLARWEFNVPVGQGKAIKLDITSRFAFNANALRLEFRRRPAGGNRQLLADSIQVKLIVRPQIDDRVNHEVTKAYTGPEQNFSNAVTSQKNGFVFAPASNRVLYMKMDDMEFFSEEQWSYMNDLPLENYYGLEHKTDLFSPGYFSGGLAGGKVAVLEAAVNPADSETVLYPETDRFPHEREIVECAFEAMKMFVVKRNEYHTVIAGYPWFLDWGRDTLIALRGMIAGKMFAEARDIILQFAAFEKAGTIPNMIRGLNDSNRETSDAPLWLAVALKEYISASGDRDILDHKSGNGGRTILEIIQSIAFYYRNGTANGIFADKASNLIYSPAHYTWMDTNYPAGTPRAGYPVEIQSLWFALQKMLAEYIPEYEAGAELTRSSIRKYFYRPQDKRLSDCLHTADGAAPEDAVADDALRPNMLFAVTLGAVDDVKIQREIVESAGFLVIPGAIRSLANLRITPPLPVKLNGKLLNNPDYPYIGHYCGPEDTRRKMAYHNGTAWCWQFPSYVEALFIAYGNEILPAARALLKSSECYFNDGCPGQLPEIADGDYPHNWGGCVAQAWSVTEFYRVAKLLGL